MFCEIIIDCDFDMFRGRHSQSHSCTDTTTVISHTFFSAFKKTEKKNKTKNFPMCKTQADCCSSYNHKIFNIFIRATASLPFNEQRQKKKKQKSVVATTLQVVGVIVFIVIVVVVDVTVSDCDGDNAMRVLVCLGQSVDCSFKRV